MVVLSGHGSGIMGDFLSKQNGNGTDSLNVITHGQDRKRVGAAIKQMREDADCLRREGRSTFSVWIIA